MDLLVLRVVRCKAIFSGSDWSFFLGVGRGKFVMRSSAVRCRSRDSSKASQWTFSPFGPSARSVGFGNTNMGTLYSELYIEIICDGWLRRNEGKLGNVTIAIICNI